MRWAIKVYEAETVIVRSVGKTEGLMKMNAWVIEKNKTMKTLIILLISLSNDIKYMI